MRICIRKFLYFQLLKCQIRKRILHLSPKKPLRFEYRHRWLQNPQEVCFGLFFSFCFWKYFWWSLPKYWDSPFGTDAYRTQNLDNDRAFFWISRMNCALPCQVNFRRSHLFQARLYIVLSRTIFVFGMNFMPDGSEIKGLLQNWKSSQEVIIWI